jgi:pimeloyl-ACP methyl ester carboxylesterase
MRRLVLALLVLVVALIALPPLYFKIFPWQPPQLPGPDQRFAVRSGLMVNAVAKGSGPTVVLVHGLPGTGYDWTPLTDALAARGFQVFAYDRIGYGRSDERPDDDFTIGANARDLLGLLESQNLRDVTIVGWSYGAPIAIEAAGRDASRIARLVLVGGAGSQETAEKPNAIQRMLFSEPVLAWLRAVPPAGRALQRAMSREAFSGQPEPDWWLPQLAANMGARGTMRSFQGENASFIAGDAAIDPVTVGQPILIVHGDDDRLVPLAAGEWVKGHARNAELVVIPGGSHMLPITHTDELADRIAEFAKQPQASAEGGASTPAPAS